MGAVITTLVLCMAFTHTENTLAAACRRVRAAATRIRNSDHRTCDTRFGYDLERLCLRASILRHRSRRSQRATTLGTIHPVGGKLDFGSQIDNDRTAHHTVSSRVLHAFKFDVYRSCRFVFGCGHGQVMSKCTTLNAVRVSGQRNMRLVAIPEAGSGCAGGTTWLRPHAFCTVERLVGRPDERAQGLVTSTTTSQ